MNKHCFIFDIDGTLADGRHRQHLVKQKPKNWPAYKRLAHEDGVYVGVRQVLHALFNQGNKIFICSGRSEDERQVTVDWLSEKCIFSVAKSSPAEDNLAELLMRPFKDSREDSIIKREMLNNIIRPRGFEPLGVFDDRNRVVQMWRSEGVHVFHVDQTSVSEHF